MSPSEIGPRVAFLSWRDVPHPQAGGSERLIDGLARGLLARGWQPVLAAGGPVAHDHPYRAIRNGGTYSQYLLAPLTYLRALRDVDVVVDVENGIPFFAPLWRRRPVVALVHHLHEAQWAMRFPRPIAAVGRVTERVGLRHVYRSTPLLVPSASTRDALAGIGVPQAQMTVLPMPAPAVSPRPKAAEPTFVVLGRLVAHKRVGLILDAWERVQRVVGGRLVIIGDGPDASELQRRAGTGVLFTGPVDDATRDAWLAEAWLLVHAAHHEGWGLVITEAAAAGTPALAMDAPGVRDAIADGVTGRLTRSTDELVTAWIALARDPHAREVLGRAARERAANYSWERTIDVLVSVLDRAIASRRRVD